MLAFDPKIRNPALRSTLACETMSPNAISKIFLDLVRTFFTTRDNFTTGAMRDRNPPLLYSDNEECTTLHIERDIDWIHKNEGQTPQIVVSSKGTQWAKLSSDGTIETADETKEDPDTVVDYIIGSVVLWCVSQVADECDMIGWELAAFLSAFANPIINEYGFHSFRVAGVSNPVRIAEVKGSWGVAVTLALGWQISQEINMQAPLLAKVRTITTIE